MGQKTNPTAFRLGIIYSWKSSWFHKKKYIEYLHEDIKIRKLIAKKLKEAAVARIEIERSEKETRINIYSSRPGVIIGRGGAGIDDLKKFIREQINSKAEFKINIEEIREPNANSQLVGQVIAEQLEKRVPFRKVMKQTLERVSSANGVKGVKIMISGRLNGSEMSRTEWLAKGRMPLHTLRADIDFAVVEAHTTYGVLGVKVWIYKGEIFDQMKQEVKTEEKKQFPRGRSSRKPSQNHSLNVK